MIRRIKYNEPHKIVEVVSEAANHEDPESVGFLNLPRDALIFDLAAGTGLLGQFLTEKGFMHMDAGDASDSMLNVAIERGWYKSTELRWFGMGIDKLSADKVCTYDCVVASGAWLKGHVPAVGMDDCHALLKTGGHFVTCMRSIYWVIGDEQGYKDKIDELIAAGKFELVHEKRFIRGVGSQESDAAELWLQ